MSWRISIEPPGGYGDVFTETRRAEVTREIVSNLPAMLSRLDPGGAPLMIDIAELPDGKLPAAPATPCLPPGESPLPAAIDPLPKP